jgi:hypothetical protein
VSGVSFTVGDMSTAAFALAIVSLLVAALSLGWQVASWALSGRRVKVRLLHGVEGRGGFATGLVKRDGSPRRLDSLRAQGWNGREVLAIEVINVGRSPVTVTSYSVLAVGTGAAYKPVGDAIGPILPYRLEPGESETWYSDMNDARALIHALASINKRASKVLMTVTLGTQTERKTRRTLTVTLPLS